METEDKATIVGGLVIAFILGVIIGSTLAFAQAEQTEKQNYQDAISSATQNATASANAYWSHEVDVARRNAATWEDKLNTCWDISNNEQRRMLAYYDNQLREAWVAPKPNCDVKEQEGRFTTYICFTG